MTRSTAQIFVVVVLGVLSMAPTAGDIGGCGTEVTALDPDAFAALRKEVDCARCRSCALSLPRCERACNPNAAPDTNVPRTCKPIAHDGDVCLRALRAASCDAYATYVDDGRPATPSECQFCQAAGAPASPPSFTGPLDDGGTP